MTDTTDLGLLSHQEFVARRSQTLVKDPQAKLDQQQELTKYVSTLSPDYRQELETLAKLAEHPLPASVRVIVTIVAYGEASNLAHTLTQYLDQDLPHDRLEIIILDNHPATTAPDETSLVVQRFSEKHPSLSIIYAHKVWSEGEPATVGNARKYVFDLALLRIHDRNDPTAETILISNDADTIHLDTNYLSAIQHCFEECPEVEALVTNSPVPRSTILKPNIYAVLSLWDELDRTVAQDEPYNLIGRSSAYRASMFAAIGGYNPRGKLAGDLETGWLVADARGWDPKSVIQLTTTKQVQNPRRILQAVASRVPVNEMYFDFVTKPEIRKADNDTLLSLIPDQLDWEQFQEDADSFWQGRTTGMYRWRNERFVDDFKIAMTTIGVEYEIINDRVVLKNIDGLLENYQRDFGQSITVIHSNTRSWDQARHEQMQSFFMGVADSIIEARAQQAEILADKIRSAEAHGDQAYLESLKKKYQRLAGQAYQS